MVQAFLTIESMEERQQVGEAMTNIRDSVLRMPAKLAREQLPEAFYVSLAQALESVGKTAEAAEVLSTGRTILAGGQVAPPLISFRVEDAPEGVAFEFFDGQVAEVAGLAFTEKYGLTPPVMWANKLARAVRDNLSAEKREKEAALNRGPLLFLIPVEIPPEKQSVSKDVLMFCENDRRDVPSFVQRLCSQYGGAEAADRASCAGIVKGFIDETLRSSDNI
jgi:hypothetical protein